MLCDETHGSAFGPTRRTPPADAPDVGWFGCLEHMESKVLLVEVRKTCSWYASGGAI